MMTRRHGYLRMTVFERTWNLNLHMGHGECEIGQVVTDLFSRLFLFFTATMCHVCLLVCWALCEHIHFYDYLVNCWCAAYQSFLQSHSNYISKTFPSFTRTCASHWNFFLINSWLINLASLKACCSRVEFAALVDEKIEVSDCSTWFYSSGIFSAIHFQDMTDQYDSIVDLVAMATTGWERASLIAIDTLTCPIKFGIIRSPPSLCTTLALILGWAFGPNSPEIVLVNGHGGVQCTCCIRFRCQKSWTISQKNGARLMGVYPSRGGTF